MQGRSELHVASKERINSILGKYSNIFVQQPVCLAKREVVSIEKDVFSITSTPKRIYIKNPVDTTGSEPPYIEIFERWKQEDKLEYKYMLCIPSLKCGVSIGSKEIIEEYTFRYEKHPDGHRYGNHLHVIWSNPHFHSSKIDFEDFFRIIENEFISGGAFQIPIT